MNEDGLLDKIFSVASGVWTLVVVAVSSAVVAWFRYRPGVMERSNERRRDAAAERADDFTRLREEVARLSGRVETLEKKVEECERERERWRTRALVAEAEVIRYEAYHQGLGEGKQVAQTILSAERKQIEDDNGGGE